MRLAGVFLFALLAAAQEPRPALEGLDPVRLGEGEEVAGNPKITARHGEFLYHFSSEDTRSRFAGDPQRYGIQLAGACARMGPPAGGNPDAYYVYQQRIYVFGSQACYKLFVANPLKYLKPAAEVWKPERAAQERGRILLDKAAASIGQLNNVRGYVETRVRGDAAVTRTVDFGGRYRTDTKMPMVEFGELITPEASFSVFRGERRKMPAEFELQARRGYERELLVLLASRHEAEVYAEGPLQLALRFHGEVTHLELEEATGRALALEYLGRGSDGSFGRIRLAFSDFRDTAGLIVPHRADLTIDGKAEETLSWVTKSFEWNPTGLAARFAAPEPPREK